MTECPCVLCVDHDDLLNEHQLHTVANVRAYGFSVLQIAAEEGSPGWSYTVGLWHSHRAPELALFGLGDEEALDALNILARHAAGGGTLAQLQLREGVLPDQRVQLQPVNWQWFPAWFGFAVGFYRRPPIPMLQVVWPDGEGRFMWEAEFDEEITRRQPQLWYTPDEHPPGRWADRGSARQTQLH